MRLAQLQRDHGHFVDEIRVNIERRPLGGRIPYLRDVNTAECFFHPGATHLAATEAENGPTSSGRSGGNQSFDISAKSVVRFFWEKKVTIIGKVREITEIIGAH